MADPKQRPDELVGGEPVGLDVGESEDAVACAQDKRVAIELPIEPGDANAQPG